ncbi:ATP-binding cassette domain-containing protein [Cryobacterium sp. Y11]|uniref:ATP-binding cassette domain-containing protein n=1 Tax=Cryobacterium sp. Y11 TaxID=2045016 RepID=UPI001304F520|nr:ATP-binding cassette domain-containing protein [Cryobacterium sp. Y11]
MNDAIRAGIPSAHSALTPPAVLADESRPRERIVPGEPMPSHWFRSQTLLDVRGLRVAATPQGNAPSLVGGISLSITRGEVIGLVGDAGSGAVQVAQSIAGVLPTPASIHSGSILFNGLELVGLSRRGRDRLRGAIAYLPRDPLGSLDPTITVGTQLAAPLRGVIGLSKAVAYTRSLALLSYVGFDRPEEIFMAYPDHLSATQAQRVHIASALAGGPDLIVADDSTKILGAAGATEIFTLLQTLQHTHELTMILVTQSVCVAAQNCHRVAVLRDGAIVEHASVTELVDSPKHPYTRKLLHAAAAVEGVRGSAL